MRSAAGTAAFTAAVVLSTLLAAASAAGIALLLLVPGLLDVLRALPDNAWWFRYRDPVDLGLSAVWRIGASLAAAAAATVAALRVRAPFRANPSPLLASVLLFLFSLSLECLRTGNALLFATDRSIAAGILLTRIVYWGRFVGLLGLLLAGLYCVEMKYRRVGVLCGVVFLVSFAMAAYIPLDRTVFLAQLSWKLGDEQGVWFVNLVIGILAFATSLAAVFTRRERRYLGVAGAVALFIAGRELLFYATSPLPLAGGVLALAAGIALCLRTLPGISGKTGERISPAAAGLRSGPPRTGR
jgi:uncharacterized membrane protein (Fun14 family)